MSKFPDMAQGRWHYFLLIFAILAVTFFTLLPSLDNGFVNWDDKDYILKNPYVHELSWSNLGQLLRKYVVGNYTPLPLLTFAAEYHFFQDNPQVFHWNNLILHGINTALVFWLLLLLTGKEITAALVALVFGIHPLHVESVAWISQRKDVLMGLFYLGGLVSYVGYLRAPQRLGYRNLTLLLFLGSVMSKQTAVSFPLVLLLLDYFCRRKLSWALLKEKIPFFLVALLFGWIAINATYQNIPIHSNIDYPFTVVEKIFLVSGAILLYLGKALLPLNLSCLYPFPEKVNGALPIAYYAAPVLVLILGAAVYRWRHSRTVTFAALWFLATIVFYLPLFSLGHAVIADRFTYLPYIGLFFLLAALLEPFFERADKLRKGWMIGGVVVYLLFFSVTSYSRCQVWKDSETLWTDALQKNDRIAVAYYNRADVYVRSNRIDLALADYNKALEVIPSYLGALNNRGNMHTLQGRYRMAITDYSRAIAIQPRFALAYQNRAACYKALKEYGKAVADYDKILEMHPEKQGVRELRLDAVRKRNEN